MSHLALILFVVIGTWSVQFFGTKCICKKQIISEQNIIEKHSNLMTIYEFALSDNLSNFDYRFSNLYDTKKPTEFR